MLRAKVGLGNNMQMHDVTMDERILGRPHDSLALAVNAWWRATANYNGVYDIRPRDVGAWDGFVFYGWADHGATPVKLELLNIGGPW